MDAGHAFGLVLLYVVMAGFAVLMVVIFVQVIFRAAIESVDDSSSLKVMVATQSAGSPQAETHSHRIGSSSLIQAGE